MTTSYIDIESLFESRKNNPLFNTSYPISPKDWAGYSVSRELPFEAIKPMAFYVHIPFCKQICSFCEYTRICVPSKEMQFRYIKALISDIQRFIRQYPEIKLYGFDIGGGTPTSLCDEAFAMLLNEYQNLISRVLLTADYEPSIEATFQTLSDEKISVIGNAGISRISLGIQSGVESVVNPLHRQNVDETAMKETIDKIHASKIKKLNLDLMYGLPGQTADTICKDLETISFLNPEQVTVYEFRTNQVGSAFSVNSETSYEQYCLLYDGLIRLGYKSNFGQNTFSKDAGDYGVSSYLRHRMLDGWQYKGFGISAQSMSMSGLSYNIGKNDGSILTRIGFNVSYEPNIYYSLPKQELLAKFIAISGYSGGFSLPTANQIMDGQFVSIYTDVLKFLSDKNLITCSGDRIQISKEGFRYYGAILSLFYPINNIKAYANNQNSSYLHK